jgi:hypothetical protein
MEMADREYRSILARHGYTDNMAFIGGFPAWREQP